jgi:hypothetical protein
MVFGEHWLHWIFAKPQEGLEGKKSMSESASDAEEEGIVTMLERMLAELKDAQVKVFKLLQRERRVR